MLRALTTIPWAVLAIALSGCSEPFVATTGGTTDQGGAAGGGATGGTTSQGGTTTTPSGGGGGAGGATCDPDDADGDGSSPCDGDCDDNDPFVHPGALEICGDGTDQDCDGADNTGDECNAWSAYVSPAGSPGAKGTKEDPVATIAEGIDHAKALGVPAAVLVAAGTYSEDLTVTGTISLVGGFDPGDWSVRDPKLYETVIKSTVPEGVKLIAMAEPMTVDGFTIQGRAVNAGTDSSVAVTIDGGGLVLSSSKITGGPVSAGTGSSVGVRIVTQGALGLRTRIWLDEISAGPASGGPVHAIEIDADSMDLTLAANDISAGKGTDSVALLVTSAAKVTAWKNSFQSSTATGAFNQPSSSLGVWAMKGELYFDSNFVNVDQLQDPPKCFTPGAWCGGLRISTGAATISNNVLFGSASDRSAAVYLLEQEDDLADVVVTSNAINGGGHLAADSQSACVMLGSPRVDAVVTAVGRFRNNLFLGGFATYNYGFWEERTPGESCDPAALDHDLFFFPVNAPNDGVLYSEWDGVSAHDVTKLEDLAGDGDDLFEDPKLEQGHLREDSPCRNAGAEEDAPNHDIDQQIRPQEGAFDIGPDEYVPPG